jgi:hypothetical protein
MAVLVLVLVLVAVIAVLGVWVWELRDELAVVRQDREQVELDRDQALIALDAVTGQMAEQAVQARRQQRHIARLSRDLTGTYWPANHAARALAEAHPELGDTDIQALAARLADNDRKDRP